MEPEGKNLQASLGARARLWSDPPQFLDTIAEGIMTQQVTHTPPVLRSNSVAMVSVYFLDPIGSLVFSVLVSS